MPLSNDSKWHAPLIPEFSESIPVLCNAYILQGSNFSSFPNISEDEYSLGKVIDIKYYEEQAYALAIVGNIR